MKTVNIERNHLVTVSLWLIACLAMMSASVDARGSSHSSHQSQTKTPERIVQSFLDTMDYQLLSAEDRRVWSESTWQDIQHDAAQANQVRLPAEHPFHELEKKVRSHVRIQVVGSEPVEDGSVKVMTEFDYPFILILIDDYIATRSSYAHEQLEDYNRAFSEGTLELNGEDVFRSIMPWRVKNGGVFVNAAQLQENREALQAREGS